MSKRFVANNASRAKTCAGWAVLIVALTALTRIAASTHTSSPGREPGISLSDGHALAAGHRVSDITPLRCTPRAVPDFIWGLTVTKISNISDISYALADLKSSFPKLKPGELPPIMVRVVFDPSRSEEEFIDAMKSYQEAISKISEHAYVMGTIADSYDWYPYTSLTSGGSTSGHNNYRIRTERLIGAMGDCIQVWEIGNEVNGEWTGWKQGHVPDSGGQLSTMREKIGGHISDAFAAVQAYNSAAPPLSKKKTAITLLYNSDGPPSARRTCFDKPEYEMRAWAKNHIDPVVRAGVDYVLLSYYENKKDCPGLMQDAGTFVSNFKALAAKDMFPNAKMGFGEIGYKETCPEDDDKRRDKKECVLGKTNCPAGRICIGQEAYIRKYFHRLNRDISGVLSSERSQKPDNAPPAFIGGYFYWFFVQDMTGKNKSGESAAQERNRNALKEAMADHIFLKD